MTPLEFVAGVGEMAMGCVWLGKRDDYGPLNDFCALAFRQFPSGHGACLGKLN